MTFHGFAFALTRASPFSRNNLASPSAKWVPHLPETDEHVSTVVCAKSAKVDLPLGRVLLQELD